MHTTAKPINNLDINTKKFEEITQMIRKVFSCPTDFIPLHAPYFGGNEKKYLEETIDSTFVSSVGPFVDKFEEMMQQITGAKYAIATTNGTTALHLSLLVAGVEKGDEVITQALTFVATANAISHAGAVPIFVDVDKDCLGMSAIELKVWLEDNAQVNALQQCINKNTGKRITACLPMHSFGLPLQIEDIVTVCKEYHIPVIEDAAESLGSYVGDKHTGTFGLLGTFSFNGNKTITCGGGGAVITNDEALAKKAKHLSTTAKIPHKWEFAHDVVGYNYRLPNLNAALACAQLEQLPAILANKRELSQLYREFFGGTDIDFIDERSGTKANYWLNTILFKTPQEQLAFLDFSNSNGVMTRPAWKLMTELPMYKFCQRGNLKNSEYLAERLVNIPSSFRP